MTFQRLILCRTILTWQAIAVIWSGLLSWTQVVWRCTDYLMPGASYGKISAVTVIVMAVVAPFVPTFTVLLMQLRDCRSPECKKTLLAYHTLVCLTGSALYILGHQTLAIRSMVARILSSTPWLDAYHWTVFVASVATSWLFWTLPLMVMLLWMKSPVLAISESRCPRCGYDLRGSSSDTCPECGLDTRTWGS